MALYEQLIKQAVQLATSPNAGRPRQADLRRSLSSCYYGLFHFTIDQCTRKFIGAGHESLALRNLASRAFSHTDLSNACKTIQGGTLPKKIHSQLGTVTFPAEIKRLAQIIVEAQDKRHDADYNLAVTFTRRDVLIHITQAQTAITNWPHIQDTYEAKAFLLCLFIWGNVRG